MTVYVHLIGECAVELWGLTSRERLRRSLARIGVSAFLDDLDTIPAGGSVLLLKTDFLFDPRLISGLVDSMDVVLHLGASNTPVAAHVQSEHAAKVRDIINGAAAPNGSHDLRAETPETLCSDFEAILRKSDPPYVLRIDRENAWALERRLYSGAYKGITDLVTKWAWPVPARWITRVCVRAGIQPNHVTLLGLLLVVLAGILFYHGHYGWGLLAGWIMTLLDTVDGKLARVTITSSAFGHVLDHGMDIIHPPIWYTMWGLGLVSFETGIPGLGLDAVIWLIWVGYIVGRLAEGVFELWLGKFGIFGWRPLDSYHRLITARRNPCLILLTLGTAAGRPDLALLAVTAWTVLSSVFVVIRVGMALRERAVSGPVRSWLEDAGEPQSGRSLAERLFTHQTPTSSPGAGD